MQRKIEVIDGLEKVAVLLGVLVREPAHVGAVVKDIEPQ
jgi:hypothetical protein